MEHLIFHHMETVRGITEQAINKIPEEIADIIPNGFRNNIRWNFGHIAFTQEKLVFELSGEEKNVPQHYEKFFAPGTSPADWEHPPSFSEIAKVFAEQKARIKHFLPGRLEEKLVTPFTNRGGITFFGVGEIFLFSLYHEAVHMETIKYIKRAISSNSLGK